MQDVHIPLTCLPERVRQRAENDEHEFANTAAVAMIDWGLSYRREQGSIVLEWEGQIDEDVLTCLATDDGVEDHCVYDVPCVVVYEEATASESRKRVNR